MSVLNEHPIQIEPAAVRKRIREDRDVTRIERELTFHLGQRFRVGASSPFRPIRNAIPVGIVLPNFQPVKLAVRREWTRNDDGFTPVIPCADKLSARHRGPRNPAG